MSCLCLLHSHAEALSVRRLVKALWHRVSVLGAHATCCAGAGSASPVAAWAPDQPPFPRPAPATVAFLLVFESFMQSLPWLLF